MIAPVAAQRVAWVDIAKGIGICLIVLGHANRSIDRTAQLSWTDSLLLLDTVLYAFHVPLFFILAGVAAGLARPGFTNGLRSLALGIVVPYLIWSVIWIGSKAILPGSMVNQPLQIADILSILWAPVDHFWFLFHLVLIRVVWLLAEHGLTIPVQRAVVIVIGLCAFGLRLLGEDWVFLAHLLENTAYFGFGLVLLSPLIGRFKNFIAAGVLCLMAFLILLLLPVPEGFHALSLVTGLSGAMAVIYATIVWVERKPDSFLTKSFAIAGQTSLVIFLLHGFAIGLVRLVLSRLDLLTNESLLYVGTIAGIALPLFAYLLIDAISAYMRKPIMTWIGWGRWRPSKIAAA